MILKKERMKCLKVVKVPNIQIHYTDTKPKAGPQFKTKVLWRFIYNYLFI